MNIPILFWRNCKWRFKNKITIVVTIIQPLIWLVLYSVCAAQPIDNYTGFILPGIMMLVIFSACGSRGMLNYVMKTQGSFERLLFAPIYRSAIILGQNLEAIFLSFIKIGMLIAISILMSVSFHTSLIGILIVLLLLFLTAFCISNIAYTLSLKPRNEMVYETVMNTLVLPLFFTSTALFPLQQMSGIFKIVVLCNPLTYIINAIREVLLYQQFHIPHLGFVICILVLLSLFTFSLSIHTLNKETIS